MDDISIRVNVVLTVASLSSATVAAIVFASPWKEIAVAVALASFSVGVVAFLWGYWSAVQRSRHEEISVAQLYFLTGGVAPRRVSVVMNSMLGAQTVGGIALALVRPSTDGRPGSTLAFGILVPMLGLGLNGLWASRHGEFPPRRGAAGSGEVPMVTPPDGENGQDGGHD